MDQQSTSDAQFSADTGNLLPGEDPDRITADEIAHWVNVYEELLTGILWIRESATCETDAGLLEDRAGHFRRRLSFWRQRGILGAHEETARQAKGGTERRGQLAP
jgi:hypothetical protein